LVEAATPSSTPAPPLVPEEDDKDGRYCTPLRPFACLSLPDFRHYINFALLQKIDRPHLPQWNVTCGWNKNLCYLSIHLSLSLSPSSSLHFVWSPSLRGGRRLLGSLKAALSLPSTTDTPLERVIATRPMYPSPPLTLSSPSVLSLFHTRGVVLCRVPCAVCRVCVP
jgi:hypothetical protein